MPLPKFRPVLFFTLLLFCCLPSAAVAQQQTKLEGYLGVEGGESFTFQLVFTEDAGRISGYSYTWLYERSEVKAAITGTIDRQNKTLTFRETQILSNNGFKSNVTICLIQATLRYRQEGNRMAFTGPITTSDITNVSCGKGSITLKETGSLKALFEPAVKADTVVAVAPPAAKKPAKPLRIVYDTVRARPARVNTVVSSGPDKVTEGVEKVYQWDSDTLVLHIWDGGRIDGDVVTVMLNNTVVLNRYTISAEVKKLVLPLAAAKTTTLTIIADNEGNEPPNTANLSLWDLAKEHPVVAYNAIGKRAVIKIEKRLP